jgi:hypothetical protein
MPSPPLPLSLLLLLLPAKGAAESRAEGGGRSEA